MACALELDRMESSEKRKLKARAQHLEPVLKLGHRGMTEAFLVSVDDALARHELVKIRFADFKEEKMTLATRIAQRTGGELIMRVGNVAVFFRAATCARAGSETVVPATPQSR